MFDGTPEREASIYKNRQKHIRQRNYTYNKVLTDEFDKDQYLTRERKEKIAKDANLTE